MVFRKKPLIHKDDDIELSLPLGWISIDGSSPNLLLFQDKSGTRQLSASVMLDQDQSTGSLRDTIERVYGHRLDAERQQLAPTDLFQHDELVAAEGGWLGIFSGADKASRRLFMGMIRSQGQ